jgi:small subunit ribosomal protein S3
MKKVRLNIQEIREADLDAYLVARNIADQLERRISYRRAVKRAMSQTMEAGAKGIKVSVGGRLEGREIARSVTEHQGSVPLHTLCADIDYGLAEAHTNTGKIGVKVWIYKGNIIPESRRVTEPGVLEPVAE